MTAIADRLLTHVFLRLPESLAFRPPVPLWVCMFALSMQIDLFRWPPIAWHYQEVIGEALKLFVSGPAFDPAQGACRQLRNRIMENALSFASRSNSKKNNDPHLEIGLARYLGALKLVQNQLTEDECLAICTSIIGP